MQTESHLDQESKDKDFQSLALWEKKLLPWTSSEYLPFNLLEYQMELP